jgi:ankyrin repeat protein
MKLVPVCLMIMIVSAGGVWGKANDVAGKQVPAKASVNQLRPQEQALFDAVKAGDKEQVKKLIADGVDVNCRPAPEWETPLFLAIECGYRTDSAYSEMPQLLISAGADIHASVRYFRNLNDWPCTLNPPIQAFQFALLQDYPSAKVVSSLLDAGADVNEAFRKVEASRSESPSDENRSVFSRWTLRMQKSTPLIAVLSKSFPGKTEISSRANEAVAILLIERGADITVDTDFGLSSLNLAIRSNSRKAAMLLIEKGVLKHMNPEQKRSAYGMALFTNFVSMLKILRENGIMPSLPKKMYNKSLEISIQLCDLEGIRTLIEYGADPVPEDFINRRTDLPLVELLSWCSGKHPLPELRKTIRTMINHGASIDQCDYRGDYPLGIGITKQHKTPEQNLREIEILLDFGANPNLLRTKAPSPLALAIHRNSRRIVELLLKHGADPAKPIRDTNGSTLTPVELAEKLEEKDILELLKEYQQRKAEAPK